MCASARRQRRRCVGTGRAGERLNSRQIRQQHDSTTQPYSDFDAGGDQRLARIRGIASAYEIFTVALLHFLRDRAATRAPRRQGRKKNRAKSVKTNQRAKTRTARATYGNIQWQIRVVRRLEHEEVHRVRLYVARRIRKTAKIDRGRAAHSEDQSPPAPASTVIVVRRQRRDRQRTHRWKMSEK